MRRQVGDAVAGDDFVEQAEVVGDLLHELASDAEHSTMLSAARVLGCVSTPAARRGTAAWRRRVRRASRSGASAAPCLEQPERQPPASHGSFPTRLSADSCNRSVRRSVPSRSITSGGSLSGAVRSTVGTAVIGRTVGDQRGQVGAEPQALGDRSVLRVVVRRVRQEQSVRPGCASPAACVEARACRPSASSRSAMPWRRSRRGDRSPGGWPAGPPTSPRRRRPKSRRYFGWVRGM